jgi:hypothetical protein
LLFELVDFFVGFSVDLVDPILSVPDQLSGFFDHVAVQIRLIGHCLCCAVAALAYGVDCLPGV